MHGRTKSGARPDHQDRAVGPGGRSAQMAPVVRERTVERVGQGLEIVEHRNLVQTKGVTQLRQMDGPRKVVVHHLVAHDLARAGKHAMLDRKARIGIEEGLQQR